MRYLLLAVLVVPCLSANAQVYKCPQTYPGKDAPATPLTGAYMHMGEIRGEGWLQGDEEAAEEGYDARYAFPDEEQAWLVCSYGGRKRNKGRFHDGHEWNQSMSDPVAEWWTKLGPKVGVCTVQVREIKSRAPKSTWTVTATCQQPSPE